MTEDRQTIIDIARKALARFQPNPESKPEGKARPKPEPEFQAGVPSGDQTQIQGGTEGGVMSDTMVSLRRKIGGAGDLQSVVRTKKALAGSSDKKSLHTSEKATG